ncbi:MAG: hypothetical protein GX247_04820 [Mollicutes bacterium]|nr:hypothetical protein [Mollicutes bacterium]
MQTVILEIFNHHQLPENHIISHSDYSKLFFPIELEALCSIYMYNLKMGIVSEDLMMENFMKSFIDEINYICKKINNNSNLTANEKCLFEYFVALGFLSNVNLANKLNLDSYHDTIDNYANKYLYQKIDDYSTRKLVFLTYHLMTLIKKEYKDICQIDIKYTVLKDEPFEFAVFSSQKNHFTFVANDQFPKNLNTCWSFDNFNLKLLFIYKYILHEKEHIKQYIKMFSGIEDSETKNWKKEIVLTSNLDFYTKYCLYFDTEQKANYYAFNNVLPYYQKVMGKQPTIEKEFFRIQKEEMKEYKKDCKMKSKEFNELFEQEYERYIKAHPNILENFNKLLGKDKFIKK